MLKKDQIPSVSLTAIGNQEVTQRPGHRLFGNKSMYTGDQVVYFVGEKPEYGVIKKILSSNESPVAEVAFVSKLNMKIL